MTICGSPEPMGHALSPTFRINQRDFTLKEVMIVLAIIGKLAKVAIPASCVSSMSVVDGDIFTAEREFLRMECR